MSAPLFDPNAELGEADRYHVHVGKDTCVMHTTSFAEVVKFAIAQGVDASTFEEKQPGLWVGNTQDGVTISVDKRKGKRTR